MKRSGFTLIELIFVIVIIGVLAATAIPKFNDLKLNAQVSNMIKPYTTVIENGKATYLNETDLNGLSNADLNITSFIDVQPITWTSSNPKGWRLYSQDRVFYYLDGSKYMDFNYRNNGQITITTHIAGGNAQKVKDKLTKQLGLTWNGDNNITTLDFTQ